MDIPAIQLELSDVLPRSSDDVDMEHSDVSPQNLQPHFAPIALPPAALAPPKPLDSNIPKDPAMAQPLTDHQIDPEQMHSMSTTQILAAPSNPAVDLLSPWSCCAAKIFLDLCSGVDHPLSSAVRDLGCPALAIDILVDNRMDLLYDPFFEHLLRLCGSGVIGYAAASPSCTEYSLLKLRPGGPKALRTPQMLDGVPDLTSEETIRLQESAILLDRCLQSVTVTHSSGGHGHLEQPSGAMSWLESSTQDWISTGGCAMILLATCAFGWDIRKTLLLASSFQELATMAAICEHAHDAHQSIAGVKDAHGVYLSKRSVSSISSGLSPSFCFTYQGSFDAVVNAVHLGLSVFFVSPKKASLIIQKGL